MKVIVEVRPKVGILDPQGKAVRKALQTMEYSEVTDVEVGKIIRLDVDTEDTELARKRAGEMAEKLLVNSNVERFRILLPGEAL